MAVRWLARNGRVWEYRVNPVRRDSALSGTYGHPCCKGAVPAPAAAV